ncbi:MAG: carbon starvation protein A [Phycisphaerae bacterium]
MDALIIALGSAVAFIVAYHTYGRWLGRRIFRLSASAVVPSVALRDDADYLPTKKSVVFGHHFTSIAGTGPIVGPAIAVMWGWLPALVWVLVGSIFVGAVHDFGALVVSLRNQGKTVGEVAGTVINRRTRLLFLCVLFLCLLIVIAIFWLVIAAVLRQYPAAIFPVMVQLPLAVAIGLWLHRRGVALFVPSLLALVLMYASVVFGDFGPLHAFNVALAAWPTWVWVVMLLAYGYAASVLPVWLLLQPRDFINSLQLLSAMGLILAGLVTAAMIGGAPPVEGADRQPLAVVAPMVNWSPAGAPPIWPFLFITIACGACSGFHCLVSSGTSSKQLASESDAQFVGYGSMLTEGFLAVLVILACVAGLGLGVTHTTHSLAWSQIGPDNILHNARSVEIWNESGPPLRFESAHEYVHMHRLIYSPIPREELQERGVVDVVSARIFPSDSAGHEVVVRAVGDYAFATRYRSWQSSDGLAAKVGAFVTGAGNFVAAMGVPAAWATALMAVLVASFAATTLDTAVRLQRYVVTELLASARSMGFQPISKKTDGLEAHATKHVATFIAVVTAGALAFLPAPGAAWSLASAGSGGLILWPLFGATNQLLAGLAFAVILFYLRRRRVLTWFLLPPMLFMLVMPAWALMLELPAWWAGGRYVLAAIAAACLGLEVWMVTEAAVLYTHARGRLEDEAPRGFEVRPVGR